MDKLVIEMLRKNPRIEVVFLGSKSPKFLITKLKLLIGFTTKDLDTLTYKTSKQNVYEYHYMVSLGDFGRVFNFIENNNTFSNDCYPKYTSFCYDLTTLYGIGKNRYLDMLFKVLHHPTVFINTDDENAILRSIGVFYDVSKENIIKAFDIANSVYCLEKYSVDYYKI